MASIEPQRYGDKNAFIFSQLTESQKQLCEKLDEIHKTYGLEMMPSKMFEGAICSSDKRLRHNPDWLSQSANSLREILYPFLSKERKNLPKDLLTKKSVYKKKNFDYEVGKIFNILNALAHHGNSDKSKLSKEQIENINFENLIYDFEKIIWEALTRQLDLYKEIDNFFLKDITDAKTEAALSSIDANSDSKDYFFAQAPIEWLDWLNENGFFDVFNKEAEVKTSYSFRLPELSYLERVIESHGDEEKVIEIMHNVDCVKHFNPEVVDQFLWIAKKLSSESLIKIIPKMQKENWVVLMKNYRNSAFSYDELVKKLTEAKEYESLLILVKAILVVNKEKSKDDYYDEYFYLKDIHETGIFETLSELKDQYAEKTIELISGILPDLVDLNSGSEEAPFTASDKFYVSDIDFFDPKFEDNSRLNFKEDIKGLLKTYAAVIKSAIGTSCETNARNIYDTHIKTLPNSQTLWRIKLFAMSNCPKEFLEDIKKELNKIFTEQQRYSQLLFGTEYLKCLKIAFTTWTNNEQRTYVQEILSKFKKLLTDIPKEHWHKRNGFEILSVIAPSLTEKEKKKCIEVFGEEPDQSFTPKPPVSEVRTGFVQDRSPVDFASSEFKDVAKIIEALKNNLSAKQLEIDYPNDDFLTPRNIEGVSNALKENMKTRISEYTIHASSFLDKNIHIHYSYSFLRGIEEYLRDKQKLNTEDWDNLFTLFDKIKNYPKTDSESEDGRWLARWNWIEKIMADLLKFFTTKDYEDLFANKRSKTLELISHLLQSADPEPKDENREHGDLYTVAINSVRGVAFEAFVNFIYLDGEELKFEVAKLYDTTISNTSLSIRFLIGRYLASFYYRDKFNTQKYFKLIFPTDNDKLEEFFAAWEGYLSSPLYKELFVELEECYEYALSINSTEYPERKRFIDPDQGISTHLALAFTHFDDVNYTNDQKNKLLDLLWSSKDTNKQKEFISFLGSGIVSHGDANEEWFKKQKINLQKLKDFWILILDKKGLEADVYSAFGFWVNHKMDIFKNYNWLAEMMTKTLKKSNGQINWDHGLLTRLPELAIANPQNTILILEKYLLEGILGDGKRKWFYLDDIKISVFEILYKVEPQKTEDLINKLLEKGGRTFWPLRKIVKENQN